MLSPLPWAKADGAMSRLAASTRSTALKTAEGLGIDGITPPGGWNRSGKGELHAGELAEHPPRSCVVTGIEDLVVRAAQPQPRVHAVAQPRLRAEETVRHLERGQLLGVEDLPLADHEPEALTSERDERGERRGTGGVLEQQRRRVVQTADAQWSLDQ